MVNKSILIVEDDLDNQELLKEIIDFSMPDCSYQLACDGEEAVRLAEKGNFDMVVMDMSVPKKNGYEVLTELRKTRNYQTKPMIALTGHAMKGVKERILDAGFDEYLAKPCKPTDIISTIKKYFDSKQRLFTR